jgi:hypothetical protein
MPTQVTRDSLNQVILFTEKERKNAYSRCFFTDTDSRDTKKIKWSLMSEVKVFIIKLGLKLWHRYGQ